MNTELIMNSLGNWSGGLTPPGCCSDHVDHPTLWLRQRLAVEVGIVMEHRFAFYYWLKTKRKLQQRHNEGQVLDDANFLPPHLLMMSWHDDTGRAEDCIEDQLGQLDQDDETEVGVFCWAGLRPLNDGVVAPAMWLNAIGDAYVVLRHQDDWLRDSRTITDRFGQEHKIVYLKSAAEFTERRTADVANRGLIWDIDLDYFTQAEGVPDQQYSPMLLDEVISEELAASNQWLQEVLVDLRGITIAIEPRYTGGLSRSLHLFEQWEKALFTLPLFDMACRWNDCVEKAIAAGKHLVGWRRELERRQWAVAFNANTGRFARGGGKRKGNPHVILLGAGASRAAFPVGDRNGRILPLMKDFIESVDGLDDYLRKAGISYDSHNIEELYSGLAEDEGAKLHLAEIEDIIFSYFSLLSLPDEPTLYDHLILSLCSKDIVATFNWDPLLIQAWNRIANRIGHHRVPRFIHLHGNVGEGHCDDPSHDKMIVGSSGGKCLHCGGILKRGPLLFPIKKKDYASHPAISAAWHDLHVSLNAAYFFTIFGYSAPTSDVEAIQLMKQAWGKAEDRDLEEVGIVDLPDHETLHDRWGRFICRGHWACSRSWYDTRLAQYPRRSCDALWSATMQMEPWTQRPIPRWATWEELDGWLQPLLDEEDEYERHME